MSNQPREHLVSVALKLFRQYGFRATGINKILDESGVAKNTLYRHFKSKDELIVASLRRQDEEFRNWLMREVERRNHGIDRLLAIFDVYEEWSKTPVFFGCMFINAAAEFPDFDSPIHTFCKEHKRLVAQYVRDLATTANANVSAPEHLAAWWMLLIDGAIVSTQVSNNRLAFQQAKAAAQNLLKLQSSSI